MALFKLLHVLAKTILPLLLIWLFVGLWRLHSGLFGKFSLQTLIVMKTVFIFILYAVVFINFGCDIASFHVKQFPPTKGCHKIDATY